MLNKQVLKRLTEILTDDKLTQCKSNSVESIKHANFAEESTTMRLKDINTKNLQQRQSHHQGFQMTEPTT